ncbi:MAG: hypothetical protein IKV03_02390 [Alphaproteobacteria bacterium]|nr:hypothetical protein [Alphaproteobacteria bacterium]
MRYRRTNERKPILFKVVLAILAVFLIYVAVVDVKPTVIHVEKTVPNAVNK